MVGANRIHGSVRMIYVTMKDGRTLRYNGASWFQVTHDQFWLHERQGGNFIAGISNDLVERIEYIKPCAITSKTGKKIKVGY